MRGILITELGPDFLIEGLGLALDGQAFYTGKVGRQEVRLVTSYESLSFEDEEDDFQAVTLGTAPAESHFRPGDILMVGSDDLLDRAFAALDEMEQRGVVVSLNQDPGQIYFFKEGLREQVQNWKEQKIPYLCLFMVEPLDSEGKAKFVTLIRKIMS